MAERAEQALREALRGLRSDEPIDAKAAERRAAQRRRHGRLAAGAAVALMLVAGVIGVPRLLPPEQANRTSAEPAPREAAPSATSAPTGPASSGWRTEYYRDISFQVPANWGHAVALSPSSWCAWGGKLRPDQRRPYVWLSISMPEPAIACGPMPDRMLTEHVEARDLGAAAGYVQRTVKKGDWRIVSRVVGSAALIVTTKDAHLAQRIADSVKRAPSDAPCRPTSPVSGRLGSRPTNASDLATVEHVDQVMLCQYEPELQPGAGVPQLRAAHLVAGQAAAELVASLQAAPVNNLSCDPPPVDGVPELAIVARLRVGSRTDDIYIAAAGCPDGDPGMAGGIDDGTKVRLLTRETCRQLLTPPVALYAGSGDLGRDCVG